jgi:hypothetical protein
MITGVKVTHLGSRNRICTEHGDMKETYDRNDLVPKKGHTADIQDINEHQPSF